MPTISIFYGIIVMMYYNDTGQHHTPHIHVKYQNDEAQLEIPNGKVLAGMLPPNKMKLVQAWIEIHQEDLMANWSLAVNSEDVFKITPLH